MDNADLLQQCRSHFPGLTWTILSNFPCPHPAYGGTDEAGAYVEVRTLENGNAVVYSYISYKLYATTLMGGEPPGKALAKAVTTWRDLAARVLAAVEPTKHQPKGSGRNLRTIEEAMEDG